MPTVLIKGTVHDKNDAEKNFEKKVAADAKELNVGDVICVCF